MFGLRAGAKIPQKSHSLFSLRLINGTLRATSNNSRLAKYQGL